MVDETDLDRLRQIPTPPVDADAKLRAKRAAILAFTAAEIEKELARSQGMAPRHRLVSRAVPLRRKIMNYKRVAVAAAAVIVIAPAGLYFGAMMRTQGVPGTSTARYPMSIADNTPVKLIPPPPDRVVGTTPQRARPQDSVANALEAPMDAASEPSASNYPASAAAPAAPSPAQAPRPVATIAVQPPIPEKTAEAAATRNAGSPAKPTAANQQAAAVVASVAPPPPAPRSVSRMALMAETRRQDGARASSKPGAAPPVAAFAQAGVSTEKSLSSDARFKEPPPAPSSLFPGRDTSRIESFASNPTLATREHPVSTFSVDVDTASYSYMRRVLQGGAVPLPQTVRVEELINYFPYDWKGPDDKDTPFKANVSIMPTPWNKDTKLMHIAIKGYDISHVEKPRANLVFLIDVSGSMEPADRLPLLKTAFRMLVNTLSPDDTVAIVTYAGSSEIALQPTKASSKDKILNAIAKLQAGGSTNGAEGLRQAYRLARESFIKDGVNRVMLATDGDFNVGQTSDADLKQLIENERKSGVFLSVFGVGLDNLNDRMMQQIAQAGNGIAAYIDNLGQAQKVMVQEATSSIFPIANDVKIQVEFNPTMVAEYRLIGYETRALNREDFNNDHVDAGDIGSGHTVTAIYEITPKGSPAQRIDDLRYGKKAPPTDNADGEYAYVKIRYKLPGENSSKLITTPVTRADTLDSFAAASPDQRFSVAVAAFAQKLRRADQLADFSPNAIIDIANGAKGSDPFGYRSEFIALVRLASALLPD